MSSSFGGSKYHQVAACVEHQRHSPKVSSPTETSTPHKRNTSTDLNGAGTLFDSTASESYSPTLEIDHRETGGDAQADSDPQHGSVSEHNQHHTPIVTPNHSSIEDMLGTPKQELNLVKRVKVAMSNSVLDPDDQQRSSPTPDSLNMDHRHVHHGTEVSAYNSQATTLTEASHPLTTNAPSMVTTNGDSQKEIEEACNHTDSWFLDKDHVHWSYKARYN